MATILVASWPRSRWWLSAGDIRSRGEQGEQSGVVDGLDGGDGVEPDAFFGGVQAVVGDAEASGGEDAEAGEASATSSPDPD